MSSGPGNWRESPGDPSTLGLYGDLLECTSRHHHVNPKSMHAYAHMHTVHGAMPGAASANAFGATQTRSNQLSRPGRNLQPPALRRGDEPGCANTPSIQHISASSPHRREAHTRCEQAYASSKQPVVLPRLPSCHLLSRGLRRIRLPSPMLEHAATFHCSTRPSLSDALQPDHLPPAPVAAARLQHLISSVKHDPASKPLTSSLHCPQGTRHII